VSYLFYLLAWVLPFLAIQWLMRWQVLRVHWKAVVFPTLIAGTYFSLCDSIAITSGLWFFDEKALLGIKIGVVPLEEALFFYLTSLLVAQGVTLLMAAQNEESLEID